MGLVRLAGRSLAVTALLLAASTAVTPRAGAAVVLDRRARFPQLLVGDLRPVRRGRRRGGKIPAPGTGQSAQRQGIGSSLFHLATPTPKVANVAGTAAPACADGGGGDNGGAGDNGGGGGGSSGGTSPPAGSSPAPAPTRTGPRRLKCKKGSKKKTVKGKAKCVKPKRKKKAGK